jgi:transcription initiation factor TFIIIB Brf1 subunit/transcription initiation factor TFIIB
MLCKIENDIVATSTSQHYCYNCAIKINLVTGQIKKDLCNDKFIPDVLYHIKSLTEKFSIPKEIGKYAEIIINTVFENTHYVSKNKLGLACAAISLANKIKQHDSSLDNRLPISYLVLQKNLNLLQKNLESIDIYSLSQRIHEMKN